MKIGCAYTAKVTEKVVPVRIDAVKGTGWSATNLATGKTIYINSAQRLRSEYRGDAKNTDVTTGHKPKTRPNSPLTANGANKPAASADKATPGKAATRPKQGQQKAKRPSGQKKAKRPSCLDAAAKILAESKKPMTCRQIVKLAFEKGYWKSDGRTPHATLYSAMIRSIAAKGKGSRFKKVGQGKFAVNPAGES